MFISHTVNNSDVLKLLYTVDISRGFRDEKRYLYLFLTVCDNSEMTYIEKFRFAYSEMFQNGIYLCDKSLCSLLLKAEIQTYPS